MILIEICNLLFVCVPGLIDNDESAETAALRELKEETGYKGEVVGVTPGKPESGLDHQALIDWVMCITSLSLLCTQLNIDE